jgi:F0F1-type ATP synthase membrane subunit b/b'
MLDFSWSNILHSNVLNFAVMIAFFAFLAYKLKLSQKIEENRSSIQKTIEESDILKENAKTEFEKVEKSLANVGDELKAIIRKAEETAKTYEEKALQDINKTVENIKTNIEKQIQSEEKNVYSALFRNASGASVDIAQKQITNALEKDKKLHRNYINEFIDSIDGLRL